MANVHKVRWGHLHEISHLRRVPGGAYSALPNRLKHLAAWRRMHMLPGGSAAHMPVRMYGTRHKVRPSSNLRLSGRKVSKMSYITKRTATYKFPRAGKRDLAAAGA